MYRYNIHKIRKNNNISEFSNPLPQSFFDSKEQLDLVTKGKFKEIIDIIFSEPSSLCSKIDEYSTENSSPAVRSFVQNVLMCDVQSLPSSPDAETAFETLLPRELYSRDGIERYSDYIRGLVNDKYKYHVNNSDNDKTTSSE